MSEPRFVRYRIGNRRKGEWVDKDFTRNEVIKFFRDKLEVNVAYRLRLVGVTEPGPARNKSKTLDKLDNNLDKASIGDTWTIIKEMGDDPEVDLELFDVRKVRVAVDIKDLPSANGFVDTVYSVVKVKFPKMGNYGWVNCRNVGGTSTPSQHTNWAGKDPGANAIDFAGTKAEMDELADYLVKNADRLDIENIIWNHRIWNRPEGWHAYTGENPHTDHVHCDGRPSRSGATNC